jgi:ubiquinone/menaquinone biosynthesis C-methylase UbiE
LEGQFKTDYFGIHEGRYKRLREDGAPGWSSDDDVENMLAFIDATFALEEIPPTAKLLELGCGDGSLSLPLAKRGYDVHGVDIAPTAITWAEEKSSWQDLKAEFKLGDVLGLPYPDEFFDVVIDGHCLHCIIGADRVKFLDEARRVLKDNGLFMVMTMCGDPREEEALKHYEAESRCMVVNGVAGRYFGLPEEIICEIKSAGFSIRHWEIKEDDSSQDDLLAVARK